jgi:hypothetical protein
MFADRTYRIQSIGGEAIGGEGSIIIGVSPPIPPLAETVRPGRDQGHGSLKEEMLVLVERDGKRYDIEEKHRDRFEFVLEEME